MGGKVGPITHARIERRPLSVNRPARVLPRLLGIIPMEAKLGQDARDCRRLFAGELNPNPLPNHLGNLEESRRIAGGSASNFSFSNARLARRRSKSIGGLPSKPNCSDRLKSPFFCFFSAVDFMVFSLVLNRSSRSVALLTKSPRRRAASGSSLQRAPRPAPCGVGLKKGDRTRQGAARTT